MKAPSLRWRMGFLALLSMATCASAGEQPVAATAKAPGPMRRLATGRDEERRWHDPAGRNGQPAQHRRIARGGSEIRLAKEIEFRRDIWCLEIKFKPVRIINVDVPQPSGQMQREPIWYMVYSVTNRGEVLRPSRSPTAAMTSRRSRTTSLRCNSYRNFCWSARMSNKSYPDRVIPAALSFGDKAGPIQLREDPNRRFSQHDGNGGYFGGRQIRSA